MAKKYRLTGIQKWMDSQKGQTFLNFAYSWGASIVILGALFKLTHIAGADLMLFIGMGTEVVVFFLAGFEHQSAIGDDVDNAAEEARNAIYVDDAALAGAAAAAGGGTIHIGGGGGGAGISESTAAALANAAANLGSGAAAGGAGGGKAEPTPVTIEGASEPMPVTISGSTEPTPVKIINAAELAENISAAPVFNSAQYYGMTPEMQEATKNYVSELNELTDTLKQVAEQSKRLTRDSEEMETMNRTLTGINRFYEMQLRSVGTQSSTIDEVNEQTKQLAKQLQELNEVYAKMVDALKTKLG
ncbi:MAG: gliding motility protein GldL [Bacteroidaceae bacterium]|jgi:hypothetical protein|nr:gliding motility protein GldL [Bacteroidaceae bacterium]MBP5523268.1 gliding motility protein GldL [Bacteroidaceae bacterium]MBQ4380036.1 gliding motility protein GldL [Bacteroidaceae bacterium]